MIDHVSKASRVRRLVQSGVPEHLDLWFFWGDVWLVTSGDFYPENQHQLFDLHWNGLFALPGLIDIEDFFYESRSQPDVFQTQDYLIINASMARTWTGQLAETILGYGVSTNAC